MLLIALGLAWLAGLLPVAAWSAPWWTGAAWVSAVLPALAMRNSRVRWRAGLALLAMALLAGWRMSSWVEADVPAIAGFIGQDVVITGTVLSEPDPGPVSTSYDIRVDELAGPEGGAREAGLVRASLHQYAELLPGDVVRLEGELGDPPVFDGFDYRSYLRQRGVWATIRFPRFEVIRPGASGFERVATRVRLRLDRSLQRALPEPQASLAAGIAFGRDGNLPGEDKEAFNRSGLRHLVAVSGSNVSLVAGVTMALALPIAGRRRAWLPAAATIAVYLVAAGFSASVIRAGAMAGIYLAGGALGRPQSGMPALAGAFVAMTWFQPGNVFDTGFQLSMAATAGLLTLGPWFDYALESAAARHGLPLPRWVTQVAALSLVATMCTAPIMWATFGEISLVGPFANLVAGPVFVVAFWTSIVAAVLGTVSSELGWLAGIVAYYPLAYLHTVARFSAELPFASAAPGRVSPTVAIAASAPVAAVSALAYRFLPPARQVPPPLERRRRMANRILVAGAFGSVAMAFIPVTLLPVRGPGELRFDFLDVGQGDAILVTTPRGRQVLIDGGPSAARLAQELGEVMPHWDRSINAVVLTHPQEDHIGGLPGLARRMGTGQIYTNGRENDTLTFEVFELWTGDATTLARGGGFTLDGVRFDVLWPPPGLDARNLNDTSIVLMVSYGGITALFTGDIEAAAQGRIAEQGLQHATILKVPHHGSKTSDPAFLGDVGAAVAVIQAGAGNRYGHPHDETLGALAGSRVYRTDQDGRVTISTDGTTIRVSTER